MANSPSQALSLLRHAHGLLGGRAADLTSWSRLLSFELNLASPAKARAWVEEARDRGWLSQDGDELALAPELLKVPGVRPSALPHDWPPNRLQARYELGDADEPLMRRLSEPTKRILEAWAEGQPLSVILRRARERYDRIARTDASPMSEPSK